MGTQIAQCFGLNSAHSHPIRTCLWHVSKATRLKSDGCDRNPLATAKNFRTFTARRRGAVLTRVFGLSLGGCLSAPIKPPLADSMHGCHPVRTSQCTDVPLAGSKATHLSADSSTKIGGTRISELAEMLNAPLSRSHTENRQLTQINANSLCLRPQTWVFSPFYRLNTSI